MNQERRTLPIDQWRSDLSSERVISTAEGIGQRINVSGDFVRDVLAKMPGTPIKQIGRKYFVVESELIRFFMPGI